MRITVKLFAILKDRAGTAETTLDLPPGSTIATAAGLMAEKFPSISDLLSRSAFALNRQYATADHPLADGDELAILPAVSGGSQSP